MTTLREFLISIFLILAILVCVGGVVVGISAVMSPREQRASPTKSSFRAACEAAKGNAAWNGRHWGCLK